MVRQAWYETKFGFLHLVYEGDTLLSLKIVPEQSGENIRTDFTEKVYRQISEYLAGRRRSFAIRYVLRGTEFQKKVWQVLEKIPYGETRTYGTVAAEIGNRKASRAVGGACNRNPIWLIVPCHRLIGANGSLTGYAGGISMKEELLRMEKSARV